MMVWANSVEVAYREDTSLGPKIKNVSFLIKRCRWGMHESVQIGRILIEDASTNGLVITVT